MPFVAWSMLSRATLSPLLVRVPPLGYEMLLMALSSSVYNVRGQMAPPCMPASTYLVEVVVQVHVDVG
jgi:hypothetical protein